MLAGSRRSMGVSALETEDAEGKRRDREALRRASS